MMQELHQLETVIALLAAVLALATAARRVLIPYPIFLVLGGLVIGVVPNVPTLRLDPDLVFLIFLPPVLWSAAYFTSLRDFRANLRPITLLAPYAAWILAERTHTSGVLACVAGGLYIRQFFSAAVAPATRIQSNAVWRLLIFVLNGVIFALIGLQLGAIREAGLSADLRTLVRLGALISIAAIAIRLIWVPLAVVIPRYVSRALRARDPIPPWPWVLLLSWIGMRGIVSLAAALALPVTTASGAPFPFRAEIILVTFAVILATLVLQGLTLTPLIRVLELGEDRTLELEEARAREEAAQAAIAHLDGLASTPWARRQDVDRLRAVYTQRIRLASPIELGADVGAARAQAAFRRLRHETLSTERRALIKLRDQGVVSDEVLHRLEQELDVEAMRI